MDVQSIDTVLFDFGGTLDAPGVHWLTRFHRLYPQHWPCGSARAYQRGVLLG